MESVLLSRLEQVLYERVDLLWTELGLEVLRHHALREARRDLRVGVLDRLLDEPRALASDVDLRQVRADTARGSGVRERVAGAAAALPGEDRLALGSRGAASCLRAAARSGASGGCPRLQLRLDEPLILLRRDDPRRDAHRRVAGAAELGADDLVRPEPVRREADVVGLAGHRVLLQAEGR